MKKLILFLLMVILLVGCASEEDAAVPEYVLTYAENQPEGYPTTLGAQKFAELVEARTGGKVVIQIKYDAELGSEQEVLDQMAFGGIDFARVSLSSISDELPVLNVLQLPFLYEDADHMWRVLDGETGDEFMEVFSQAGLVGLSWYDAGARSFYANTPIRSPRDMAGLTVRVQDSQMMLDMVELLGATAVTFAYSDVYSAFETRKIDAAENNWPAYQILEHYKVARYYTVDQHTRVPEIQLASARLWAKLPQAYRDIIAQCALESAQYQRRIWTEQEAQSRTDALARGCCEIALTQEAYLQFQEAVRPLYETYCADYLDLIQKIQEG